MELTIHDVNRIKMSTDLHRLNSDTTGDRVFAITYLIIETEAGEFKISLFWSDKIKIEPVEQEEQNE